MARERDVSGAQRSRRKGSPAFVGALFAFALFNIMLDFVMGSSGYKYAGLLFEQNQRVLREFDRENFPQLVFLGSSIIEVPLSLLDGRHHYSPEPVYAEQELSKALARRVTAEDLSIEAALISDQYLALWRLSQAQRAPETVVLCLAPRDFYDTRWPKRSQTCTFRGLAGFSEVSLWPMYLDGFEQYFEFLIYRSIEIYRIRNFLVSALDSYAHPLLSRFYSIIKLNGLAMRTADTAAGQKPASLALSADSAREKRMRASMDEYRDCYRLIDKSANYKLQQGFLEEALSLCQSRRLRLLLVNMPLTKANRELLPDSFYESFKDYVSACARRHGVPLLDLTAVPFEGSDFYDSAHLDASGGKKLLLYLVPYLTAGSKSRDRLHSNLPE